jgi:hypothetical protein
MEVFNESDKYIIYHAARRPDMDIFHSAWDIYDFDTNKFHIDISMIDIVAALRNFHNRLAKTTLSTILISVLVKLPKTLIIYYTYMASPDDQNLYRRSSSKRHILEKFIYGIRPNGTLNHRG